MLLERLFKGSARRAAKFRFGWPSDQLRQRHQVWVRGVILTFRSTAQWGNSSLRRYPAVQPSGRFSGAGAGGKAATRPPVQFSLATRHNSQHSTGTPEKGHSGTHKGENYTADTITTRSTPPVIEEKRSQRMKTRRGVFWTLEKKDHTDYFKWSILRFFRSWSLLLLKVVHRE